MKKLLVALLVLVFLLAAGLVTVGCEGEAPMEEPIEEPIENDDF